MAKISFFTKVQLTKASLVVAKQFPKLAIIVAVCSLLWYAGTFLKSQHQQLVLLQETVVELRNQNKTIIDANASMDADMKTIKVSMETFNSRIFTINQNTKTLEQKFKDQKFQVLLQTNLPKAEIQFNNFFNEYLMEINDDTLQFSK